jgi:hypothetical protein
MRTDPSLNGDGGARALRACPAVGVSRPGMALVYSLVRMVAREDGGGDPASCLIE